MCLNFHENSTDTYFFSFGLTSLSCAFYFIEFKTRRGRLLATIPRFSTEWSVKLYLKIQKLNTIDTDRHWYSVLQLHAKDRNYTKYGRKMPAILTKSNSTTLQMKIVTALNGDGNHFTLYDNYPINQLALLEMKQRYVSGGRYLFSVEVNANVVHTIINTDARQFYNVQVFASSPWRNTSPFVYISNLEITNFL